MPLNGRDDDGFTASMRSRKLASIALHRLDEKVSEVQIFSPELSNALIATGLPAQAAADILGMSKSKVKRLRRKQRVA